jgi:putative membrane protein
MSEHIDQTVKRYSALFTLPSHRMLVVELFIACTFVGILVSTALRLSQPYGLMLGLSLGVTFFALTLATDFIIHLSSVKVDPVFDMRRSSALSFYSILSWSVVTVLGILVNVVFPDVWFKFFIMGFCAALALRLIVLLAVSFARFPKIAVFAGLQPLLWMLSVVYTTSAISTFSLSVPLLTFFLVSVAVTVVTVLGYMYLIDRVGVSVLGVGSFSVLRAFMANWAEDLNAPFEQLFERFSQQSEIRISLLSFRNAKGKIKATIIVPALHPGPFKNIGSSELPYMIQDAVENKLKGCVAMVPHGLSGHNLDLATQSENQLVLEKTLELTDFSGFGSSASLPLRIKRNGASVVCQVFNNCALVTLTLAPQTMEDLPPELDATIIEAAKRNGFSTAVAVDAHNCINGPFRIEDSLKPLQEAALACLEKASQLGRVDFQVGVSRVHPEQYSLKEGLGPGGVAVLAVKAEDQTTGYVTIDGNNMIAGLREEILLALSQMGISEGEVFTTDTHAVNAVVMNARGYHPVGEAMDQAVLIDHVKEAAKDALKNLEPAQAAWSVGVVPNVKVIGEQQIAAMSTLLDKAMRRARNLAILVFPLVTAVLVALLFLLQ